ncbi:MAG: response regulator transcription factor [Ardenticatenaceae bacterium]|nr:response regulator transcription factor [Ardenticatenaceae bacterium]
MTQTILIIEDEPQIVTIVRGYLTQTGFEVASASDGHTGLFMVRQQRPDLVILDLMLPGMDGLDVARAIRRDRDPQVAAVPLLMLTARVEEADKLIGLELGADDYITKPFSPRELVARVRALLRRVARAAQTAPALLRGGPLTLDPERRLVFLDNTPLDLTPTEFDLLATMMAASGRPFSRMELLEASQGDAYEGYERTIDVHIKNLRRKLGDDGRAPRFIQTVLNHGYRFAADLEVP